jgi:hypothetical protein
MLGLSRTLVEHALPIKPRFKPYRQPVRNYSPDLMDHIKEEIERLLKANFIRPCHYVEWISNIVPVEKKNTGKIRVCIDFRNLNRATPKDEYPMPGAHMLINRASGNKMISFFWMGTPAIIRYSWWKMMSPRWHSGVLVLWVCLSGWL